MTLKNPQAVNNDNKPSVDQGEAARVPSSKRARKGTSRDATAQATRDAILKAATKVFAQHGFAGGSVEKISQAARTYDRMIYYYFGSKEGLFVAVLEGVYQRMDDAESAIAFDLSRPMDALTAVIRFVHGYYRRHPEFVTLINTENLHKGRHIAKSKRAREYSSKAVSIIEAILAKGVEQKVFRQGISAREVYLLITASGYFYTSNQYTLSSFLGEDLDSPAQRGRWEAFVIDSVLRIVRK
ncbi:TetR/AcrR family transcriptional regulator [Variovorax humicola]|uniref:TetR/AcrR family transcriptional regulator n=1 Tax=Variovorax humicola TaxID=1769758 RepID=UPI003BF6073C